MDMITDDYAGKRIAEQLGGEFCDCCTTWIAGDYIRVVDPTVNQLGEQEVYIYCLECGTEQNEVQRYNKP